MSAPMGVRMMRATILRCAGRWGSAGLVLALASVPLGAEATLDLARVTAITGLLRGPDVQVVLTASKPVRPQLRDIRRDWIVLDVPGSELGIPPGTLPIAGGPIVRVRVGQFLPTVVRVVVELSHPVAAHLGPALPSATVTLGIPAGVEAVPRALPGPPPPPGRVRVTGVTVREADRELLLVVAGSGPLRYRLTDVRPDWIVLDVPGAELDARPGPIPVDRGLVRRVRLGQFRPDVVRVVVELVQPVRFRVAAPPGGGSLVVGIPAEIGGQPIVARASPTVAMVEEAKASVPAAPAPPSAPPPPSGPLPVARPQSPLAQAQAAPPRAAAPAPSREILPGQGIGPVRLGMAVKDVLALLGPQKSVDQLPNGEAVYRWFAPPANDGIGVRVTASGVVSRVWALNDADYVLRGTLRVGSTEEEVRAALGAPSRVAENTQVKTRLLYYDALGIWVSIQLDERYAFYNRVFEIGVMPPG